MSSPFRGLGQYYDVETRLSCTRYRYWEAETGRWLSADPLGIFGGANLLGFNGVPTVFVDPMGLACKRPNSWNEFQALTKGQYSTRAEAAAAYRRMVDDESPWPEGVVPTTRVMAVDETFHMAMGPGQTYPGEFGTTDHIPDVASVRRDLAVKEAWKDEVSHVTTFRVTKPLPVQEGPIGPQVDNGKLLPGGGSQLQMMVPPGDRMEYLEVVSSRPIS